MTKCQNCDSSELRSTTYSFGALPLPALECTACGCLVYEESRSVAFIAPTLPPLPCVSSLPPTRR